MIWKLERIPERIVLREVQRRDLHVEADKILADDRNPCKLHRRADRRRQGSRRQGHRLQQRSQGPLLFNQQRFNADLLGGRPYHLYMSAAGNSRRFVPSSSRKLDTAKSGTTPTNTGTHFEAGGVAILHAYLS